MTWVGRGARGGLSPIHEPGNAKAVQNALGTT